MYLRRIILFISLLLPCASYSHPASIGEYPERFPGKTLQQIRDEWEPAPQDAWSEADLLAEARGLVESWAKLTAEERLTRVKRLAEENRRGDYRKRFANLAHDLADLSGADAKEAQSYLEWRIDHLNDDDGYFDPVPSGAWDEKPEAKAERERLWADARRRDTEALRAQVESADATLQPHWLVQAGALEFRHRRYREAEGYFKLVEKGFSYHPRAEVATLMLARLCWVEWWQAARWPLKDAKEVQRLEAEWSSAAQNYHRKYPQGRFKLDLDGWEAAHQWKSGNAEMAMRIFLAQSRDPAHPEVRRRAFQHIEWMLHDLVEVERLPWHDIAKEPLVALRIGYHLLDARSQTDLGAIMQRRSGEDHRVLETLVPELHAVRTRAQAAWTLLDAALDWQSRVYEGKFASVRETLHAWALITRSRASVVLGLDEKQVGEAGADDLALTRMFALIKAGRYAEAVTAIEAFQSRFGGSPLNRGLTLRLVDAWVELGRTEKALPLLWDMMEGRDTATLHDGIDERPALHLPGEVTQRVTALLSFAPLEQLTKTAEAARGRPELRSAVCGVLRTRYLVQGAFDSSLTFAEDEDFEKWHDGNWNEEAKAKASRWRDVVNRLKKFTQEASDAASWAALGREWQRHPNLLEGGRVYLPQPYFVASFSAPSHELRAMAAYLHLPDGKTARLLDERHALTHARVCFERAGDLLALHETLRARAETSPYWMDRAVEVGDADFSKRLVAQIQRPEIVPWTFRPADTMGEWKPGRGALWQVEVEIAEALGSVTEGFWENTVALKKLHDQVQELTTGQRPLDEVRTELSKLRESVKREAPVLKAASLINHIDDLSLLAAQPGIDRAAYARYAELRQQNQPMPAEEAALTAMKDFVSFWNAVITPSGIKQAEVNWRQRSAETQVERMTAFLSAYPQSPKREAALARLAINTLRMSRCHCALESDGNGYAAFVIERGVVFDEKKVLDAISQYEREFPKGRYLAEMQLLRGLTAAETQVWKTSLGHLVPLLNNPAARDLHLDASNTTASIFMMLLEPERRLEVKAAIEDVPGAKEKLLAFMQTPSAGWRLRLIDEWLRSWIRR